MNTRGAAPGSTIAATGRQGTGRHSPRIEAFLHGKCRQNNRAARLHRSPRKPCRPERTTNVNIGLFSDSFTPEISGVVSSIETLREALEKRGHHVYVFTAARPDATVVPGVFRLPSMPLLFLKSLRFAIFYTPRAARSVKRVQLDVIHTQTEFSLGLFGKMMALRLGIPVVHTYHTMYKDYTHYVTKGHFIKFSQDLVRMLTKNYLAGCRLVVAPTEKVASLLASYGVNRPVRIIPSGVKLDRFMEAARDPQSGLRIRQEFGIAPHTPLLVFVGRIAKEKSIDMILDAMPAILRSLPTARLLIVGDGPERTMLEERVRADGLSDAVRFAGPRPWAEIPGCYCAGDVFVSASTTETQGLTVLEAMACGVPVLARNDPSYASMIGHNRSGMLFDNAGELADQAARVLADRGLARSLAEGAMETVRLYAAETFGERIEALYREALETPLHRADFRSFRVVGHASRLSGKGKAIFTGRRRIRRKDGDRTWDTK